MSLFTNPDYMSDENFDKLFINDVPTISSIISSMKSGVDSEAIQTQEENISLKRTFNEMKYTCAHPDDVRLLQMNYVDLASSLFGLSTSLAKRLLWYFNWDLNSLLAKFILCKDIRSILEEAALYINEGSEDYPPHVYQITCAPIGYKCSICFERNDAPIKDYPIFQLACGHSNCVDCYRSYIREKISNGESQSISCPQYKCKTIISEDALELLFSPASREISDHSAFDSKNSTVLEKYQNLLDREFVSSVSSMRFCPAPECSYIIQCLTKDVSLKFKAPIVECDCGETFCFECDKEDHRPATCEMVKKWLTLSTSKNEDLIHQKLFWDKMSEQWIDINTKTCTKCNAHIEKDGGCSHMTCSKCGHNFCWDCKIDWSVEHRCVGQRNSTRNSETVTRMDLYESCHRNYRAQLKKLENIKLLFEQLKRQLVFPLQNDDYKALLRLYNLLAHVRRVVAWSHVFEYFVLRGKTIAVFRFKVFWLETHAKTLQTIFEGLQVTEIEHQLSSKEVNLEFIEEACRNLLQTTVLACQKGLLYLDGIDG